MAEDETLLPLGQLFVRVGLNATGKGKAGREKKDHTLTEIKKLFLEALSAKMEGPVPCPAWFGGDAPAVQPGPTASASCNKQQLAATLDDHSKPLWIARKAGFDIGKSVCAKIRVRRQQSSESLRSFLSATR